VQARTILNRLLTDVTPSMHKTRRKSLNAMVSSLISGASLSVTSLGRHLNSATSEKHQIKRSMRLCSNPHLQSEITTIYTLIAQRLIVQCPHPVILIDWSDLDPRKQHFLLRASVAVKGRSLTLLERIYPLSRKEKPSVHKLFMEQLKTMLPAACKPTIVTDAGFRGPWFKLVESLGWDYVGRVRNRTFCKGISDNDWHPMKDLYASASSRPKALGGHQLCRRNPVSCQLYVYRRKHKGRRHVTVTGDTSRRSSQSRANANRV